MGYTWAQLPALGSPSLADALVVGHEADGNLYQASLQSIANLIGGGSFAFDYEVDLSALTIYNYGNFTVTPNNSAASNTAAFTALLNKVSTVNPQGGEIWIPQFQYAITPGNFNVPTGVSIRALGTGGSIPNSANNFNLHFLLQGDGNFLNLTAVGQHTLGGCHIENLSMGWADQAPAALSTSTAIMLNTTNGRIDHCNFLNCPQVAVLNGLSCGLEESIMEYRTGPNGTGPNVTGSFAAITMQAPEVFAHGPGEWFQTTNAMNSPITNMNCVAFAGSCENGILQSLHIQHWAYGVTFNVPAVGGGNGTASWPKIISCEIASWITAVYLQPAAPPVAANVGQIYGAKFIACTLSQDPGIVPTFPNNNFTSVVYIDSNNGGNNSNVSDVEFTNCTVFNGNKYGYEINTGENIRIIGGMSSGNGNSTTNNGNPGAGIGITGPCGNVLVSGVDLNAKFSGSATPGQAQTYAVLVTGNPTGTITVQNCDMSGSGYTGLPIHVTGTPVSFNVFNCPGYNDQAAGIPNGQTITTGVAYMAATAGTVLGGPAINYFGPQTMIFTLATGGTFSVNGAASFTITATQTIELYLPTAYTTIQWGVHAPSQVQWVGV